MQSIIVSYLRFNVTNNLINIFKYIISIHVISLRKFIL
uniref:Uncharacterized protein n=1 Tax=Podoviridae sp. ct8Lf7 TaxID=2827723 RepID=A0A8S5S112_9CAUD|nr:MAG TPA: hypothetical protein [Podoviridae sp. ct8Lf7]